jgi:hypothetical protein
MKASSTNSDLNFDERVKKGVYTYFILGLIALFFNYLLKSSLDTGNHLYR